MFSTNRLRLDVLKRIEPKIRSEGAVVILNLFFGGPGETWHHHVPPPCWVLYRLHRREHVIIPRRGDWVKCEVHQIGEMLFLDTESEVGCRLIQDVVSCPASMGIRGNGIIQLALSRHTAVHWD